MAFVGDNGKDEKFAFSLTSGQSEIFDISAFAKPDPHNGATMEASPSSRRLEYSWLAKIYMIVDGRQVIEEISDNGAPFVTTAMDPEVPTASWDGDQWHLS